MECRRLRFLPKLVAIVLTIRFILLPHPALCLEAIFYEIVSPGISITPSNWTSPFRWLIASPKRSDPGSSALTQEHHQKIAERFDPIVKLVMSTVVEPVPQAIFDPKIRVSNPSFVIGWNYNDSDIAEWPKIFEQLAEHMSVRFYSPDV